MFHEIKSSVTKLYIIMLVTLCFFIHSKQENGTTEGRKVGLKYDARKALRDFNYISSDVLIKSNKHNNKNITRTDHSDKLLSYTDSIDDINVDFCNKSGNASSSTHIPDYCKLSADVKQYQSFQVQLSTPPVLNLSKKSELNDKSNSQDNESVSNVNFKNTSLYRQTLRTYENQRINNKVSARKRKVYVLTNSEHLTGRRDDRIRINKSLSRNKISHTNSSDSESSEYDLFNLISKTTHSSRGTMRKRFGKSIDRVMDESIVEDDNNNNRRAKRSEVKDNNNRKKTSSINILRKILQQKISVENEDRINSTDDKNHNQSLNKIINRRKHPVERKVSDNNTSEAFDRDSFDKNAEEQGSNGNDFVVMEDASSDGGSDMRIIPVTVQDTDSDKESFSGSTGFNLTMNAYYIMNRNNLQVQSPAVAELPTEQDSSSEPHRSLMLPSATVSPDENFTTPARNLITNKEHKNKPVISVHSIKTDKRPNVTISDTNRNRFDKSSDNVKTTTMTTVSTKNDKQQRHALLGNKDHVTWPVKLSAEVAGDLILGGLMMVHEREDTITCGPIMPQGGIQALETMLYTLDVINAEPHAPFTLGAHILDDCDKDTYGLEMAVDFIKGSISNIDGAEYHCNKTQVRKVISGVVGAASSVTSIQVANLLRLFKIPQVSFFSTSPELSNKQRFEYFTRTIPSDHYQVKAMVEIVRRLGWSYVSIVYEESNYGIKAFEELESLLAKYDICIAVKEKLVKDSGVAEETAYDNIVFRLLTKPRARGAIIFGSDQEVAGLMRAVRRCNATGSFSWIGSDGWSARSLVWQGSEAEVEGTLSVQPQANPVRGFDSYFLNLTAENNKRNPWFVEFWEGHFQCRYPNSTRTPYNQRYTRTCSTKERLTRDNTAFENQLQFVSDAVMAFAVALRDMHSDLCHGRQGLCDNMRPTKGTELLKYLRKVNFEGLSGDKFHFDANGDGPARYNIIHFKQISEGDYRWVRVGEYIEGELKLNMSDIQFKLNERQPPESVCSLPCDRGQAKKYVEGESCCWHCFNCTQYQIRHSLDETQCVMCREGTVPDSTKQVCLEIPEVFLRVESAWAIGAMSLSATGMLVTLFVVGVFLRHNDTPVVKAAGRELSYVLLTGILLCYLVTFALVIRPTDVVCGIQRFGTGFCFTVVYAALFTKTNRISRIFNASKRTVKQLSFISPKSQLIICSGLVSIQVLINAVWMVVSPPRAIHHYPTREDNLLVCASYVNASYMIAFGYPIVLILICTVYAVLTRNIPEAFNESKHIGFTMYTTCVIWLAFVPLYFGTGSHMPLRITSMSVTISLSASVTLVCLFSPKLYIILIRPERNVRQSMMPSRHGALKTGTTASVMVGAVPVTHTTQPFAQVLGQHENIALELNNDKPKAHKHHGPVQVATKSTQTQQLQSLNNKSPTAALVNNVVNNISSVVINGPPVYDMQH